MFLIVYDEEMITIVAIHLSIYLINNEYILGNSNVLKMTSKCAFRNLFINNI